MHSHGEVGHIISMFLGLLVSNDHQHCAARRAVGPWATWGQAQAQAGGGPKAWEVQLKADIFCPFCIVYMYGLLPLHCLELYPVPSERDDCTTWAYRLHRQGPSNISVPLHAELAHDGGDALPMPF